MRGRALIFWLAVANVIACTHVIVEDDGGGGEGPAGAGGAGLGGVSAAGGAVGTGGFDGTGGWGGAPPTFPEFLERVCPEMADWNALCLTFTIEEFRAIDPITGSSCHLNSTVLSTNSLAIFGDDAITCDDGKSILVRMHMPSGETTEIEADCSSVARYGDSLAVLGHNQIQIADSFDAYADGAITKVLPLDASVSRITVTDDRLYAAWHSTDTIERFQLPGVRLLPPVALEEFDDWVHGLAVLDDGRIVVLSNTVLATFSPEGAEEAAVPLSTPGGGGLACWSP